MRNPQSLQDALTRPLDENLDSHTGTTGDSMSELSDSSAGRSATGSALSSMVHSRRRTPHSGAPIVVRSRRREPLFGPSGSRVYDGQPTPELVQALQLAAVVQMGRRAKVVHIGAGGDNDDDGRNAMATLSAAALDAGEGGP